MFAHPHPPTQHTFAYSGGRQDRLYERAIHDFHYDPYSAPGQSWGDWYNPYGW